MIALHRTVTVLWIQWKTDSFSKFMILSKSLYSIPSSYLRTDNAFCLHDVILASEISSWSKHTAIWIRISSRSQPSKPTPLPNKIMPDNSRQRCNLVAPGNSFDPDLEWWRLCVLSCGHVFFLLPPKMYGKVNLPPLHWLMAIKESKGIQWAFVRKNRIRGAGNQEEG